MMGFAALTHPASPGGAAGPTAFQADVKAGLARPGIKRREIVRIHRRILLCRQRTTRASFHRAFIIPSNRIPSRRRDGSAVELPSERAGRLGEFRREDAFQASRQG